MNFKFLDHHRIRQILTILFLPGALACMFPPPYPFFLWWSEQAIFVALGYLFLGLFFLVINKTRLMFVCFGCCAAICFLKNETGANLMLQSFSEPMKQILNNPLLTEVPRRFPDFIKT